MQYQALSHCQYDRTQRAQRSSDCYDVNCNAVDTQLAQLAEYARAVNSQLECGPALQKNVQQTSPLGLQEVGVANSTHTEWLFKKVDKKTMMTC